MISKCDLVAKRKSLNSEVTTVRKNTPGGRALVIEKSGAMQFAHLNSVARWDRLVNEEAQNLTFGILFLCLL